MRPATYKWAERHTVESWRERYKKRAAQFDPIIEDIVAIEKPTKKQRWREDRRASQGVNGRLYKNGVANENDEGGDEDEEEGEGEDFEAQLDDEDEERDNEIVEPDEGMEVIEEEEEEVDQLLDDDEYGQEEFEPLRKSLRQQEEFEPLRKNSRRWVEDEDSVEIVEVPEPKKRRGSGQDLSPSSQPTKKARKTVSSVKGKERLFEDDLEDEEPENTYVWFFVLFCQLLTLRLGRSLVWITEMTLSTRNISTSHLGPRTLSDLQIVLLRTPFLGTNHELLRRVS